MQVQIQFPTDEDQLRAIDILAEADVGYQGIAEDCYLISDSAVKLLRAQGVRVLVSGERKETSDAAGS